VQTIKSKADSHAMDLRSVIDALAAENITSLGAIAAALNDRGMQTPRGGQWYKTSVSNLLSRLAATEA
jgi:hypothetical protein